MFELYLPRQMSAIMMNLFFTEDFVGSLIIHVSLELGLSSGLGMDDLYDL